MPNIRTPSKKIGRPADVAAPVAVEVRASRRVQSGIGQAGQACLRVCEWIEIFKARGAATAAIEAQLGLDPGDLKAHFDACSLVAENAGFTPVEWTA